MATSDGGRKPGAGEGRITAVRGSVVESWFPDDLAAIKEAFTLEGPEPSIVLELALGDRAAGRDPAGGRPS